MKDSGGINTGMALGVRVGSKGSTDLRDTYFSNNHF